jgi:EF-P beta-lysylation protein EpmB
MNCSSSSWQEAMKTAVRDSANLMRLLGLDSNQVSLSSKGEAQFPVFVPLPYLSRIRPGDPFDPLLLQVMPQYAESVDAFGFVEDPVGDLKVEKSPGLLHKYPGRVLMVVSGSCAIHCRYCFRRHFPYELAPKSLQQWEPTFRYIEEDDSIHEVILSGGDPLTLVDSTLQSIVERIASIDHVQRLRVHTRLPVVIPQRVTDALCEIFSSTRLATWVVLHINHAREIDGEVEQSISRLRNAGATLLNQAVLLRGVNDNVDALRQLFEKLVDCNVSPYYLHQLDRVAGGAHFEVPLELGQQWIADLRKRLPGYAIPLFVQEIAGEESKTAL